MDSEGAGFAGLLDLGYLVRSRTTPNMGDGYGISKAGDTRLGRHRTSIPATLHCSLRTCELGIFRRAKFLWFLRSLCY
jgi:hypothetical protein